MRRLLLCAALCLVSACIKRVAPGAVEDRVTTSGVPLTFGQPRALPDGARILWDFGDGTPQASGPVVEHAFPHAGAFTITQTIRDKDGQQRTSSAHATVKARTVAMAVPADARGALVVPRPWARLQQHRRTAERLSLGSFYDEVVRTLSDGLGFDALDPKQADANGFDPDEGLALYTVPQDPEALVITIGTSDDAKALAAVKRMLGRERVAGRFSGGAVPLSETRLADGTPALTGQLASGEKVAVVQRYGYLYVRTAGLTDPALALQSALALAPDQGLSQDPAWLAAMKHVGDGDASFFSRGSPPAGLSGSGSRLSQELGSSAFSVIDTDGEFRLRYFGQLKNVTPQQLAKDLAPSRPPPDLAARLPAGAAAYLKLSASPSALWHELLRSSGADASRLRDRVQEVMGLDVEKDLLPAFTGNVGVAVYLDAGSLIEAVMGEQVGNFDRSSFLVAAELDAGKAAVMQAALDRATRNRAATDRVPLASGVFYRLGDAAQAALKDGFFYLSFGGPAAQPAADPAPAPPKSSRKKPAPPPTAAQLGPLGLVLLPSEGASTLGATLQKSEAPGFDKASSQDLWVDIAGLVHALQSAAEKEGGMASVGARLLADRAAGLRDAQLELRAGDEGAEGELRLRFK
jgi:hypothetical protein